MSKKTKPFPYPEPHFGLVLADGELETFPQSYLEDCVLGKKSILDHPKSALIVRGLLRDWLDNIHQCVGISLEIQRRLEKSHAANRKFKELPKVPEGTKG
jgi:hypothetical protein